MLFSPGRRLNVLTGLIRSRGIEVNYTFGKDGKATFILDSATYSSGLLPQMLDIMSGGGEQQVGFKITPLPAQGVPFTTGNAGLDRLAANALQYVEGGCKFPSTRVTVVTYKREHQLVFPGVYLHIGAVRMGRAEGEFALATNLAMSGYLYNQHIVSRYYAQNK